MEIKILKEEDIKKLFTMMDAIEASKYALKLNAKGKSDTPLRVNLDVKEKNGQSLYMPGYVRDVDVLGLKIISIYPENIERGLDSLSSLMILQNSETGEVSSIMDGSYLTKLRTGAISGAATEILAREDANVFALIGTGGQASTQLEAVLNVRKIKEVRVYGRNQEKAKNFVNEMNKKFKDIFDCNIILSKTADEAIRDADIITTATSATSPVFDGRLVKKGTHINAIGSYTPKMQEIDPYLICKADKIYFDSREGVLKESGDFIRLIKEGSFLESDITGELGEALLATIALRENDGEISLFKSVGMAVLDLVTAKMIYDRAQEKKIGSTINF